MAYTFKKMGIRDCSVVIVLLLLLAGFVSPEHSWGDDTSGLSLNLYTKKQGVNYNLADPNDPIDIIVVMQNISQWPINTERGFSDVELQHSLVITDPGGKKHILNEGLIASNMPPPVFWNGHETAAAEVLEVGWARSVTLSDLGAVFPMMNTTPGWYSIEAEQVFVRFPWTIQESSMGLLGVVDTSDGSKYWSGNVKSSNVLKIFVSPPYGGQFKIRTMDMSIGQPAKQVTVNVYSLADVVDVADLPSVWAKSKVLLMGTSDFQGWVFWGPGTPCIPKGEYLAIGYYQNEYKAALFENNADGWATGCSGGLERHILFKEQQHEFSLFAFNSVWLRNGVRIESGDVGVQEATPGPHLFNGYEIALGGGALVGEGWAIKGDSVYLESTASAWDVYTNDDVAGGGVVKSSVSTPLTLPVWKDIEAEFPEGTEFNPSDLAEDDRVVPSQGYLKLPSDEAPDLYQYRDIVVGAHAKLELRSGTYHFNNLTLSSHASIVCLGHVEIRIKGRLESGSAKAAYLGPDSGTGHSAADVIIFVAGEPEAVLFGQGSEIRANIFARNGSIVTGEGSTLTGSFIARDVTIGQKSVVHLESAFSINGGEMQNNPPQAGFTYDTDGLIVNFTDTSSDPDGDDLTWAWEFGDGETSTEQNPVHDYVAEGTYAVQLTVTEAQGEFSSDKVMQNVTVTMDGIDLTYRAYKEVALQKVDLMWTGAIGTTVEIQRDHSSDSATFDPPNEGIFTDVLGKKPKKGDYTYTVCETDGSDTCSNSVTVTY